MFFKQYSTNIKRENIEFVIKKVGFDISKSKLKNKRQVINNCVEPELGLHIFKCAFKEQQKTIV